MSLTSSRRSSGRTSIVSSAIVCCIRVVLKYSTGDSKLMDLVGTIIDPCCPLMTIPIGERRIVRHAQCTVDLDRPIEYLLEDVGDVELDHRDVVARVIRTVALDSLCGV